MDNYNSTLKDLKNIEKEINDQIRQLKEKQNESTVKQENQIKKRLDDFSGIVVKLFNDYQNPQIQRTFGL